MTDTIDHYYQNMDAAPAKVSHDEQNSYNRTPPLPPLSALEERSETTSPERIPTSHGSTTSPSESPRRDTHSRDTESSTRGSMRMGPSEKESFSSRNGLGLSGAGNFADFFSPEVFYIVLHNPTTAHRFLKFCQSRSSSEDLEFLQKV